MSVKIRLSRAGKVKRAFFHIVVADSRSARDGKIIEKIGYYDPEADPRKVELKSERVIYWLSKGAQPSRTVYQFLKDKGIVGSQARASAPQAPSPTGASGAEEKQ